MRDVKDRKLGHDTTKILILIFKFTTIHWTMDSTNEMEDLWKEKILDKKARMELEWLSFLILIFLFVYVDRIWSLELMLINFEQVH